MGIVFLKIDMGSPQNVSVGASGTVLGTLPAGYRPTTTHSSGWNTPATTKSSAVGQLTVDSSGTVTGYNFEGTSMYFAAAAIFPADN